MKIGHKLLWLLAVFALAVFVRRRRLRRPHEDLHE